MPATNPFAPATILKARYKAFPSDWQAVTRSHEYEDGTRSFNLLASSAPKRWEVVYTGLTTAERDIFIAHFEEKGFANTFTFRDKDGNDRPDVRYESFEADHPDHKSWDGMHSVIITLVEYDASNIIHVSTPQNFEGSIAGSTATWTWDAPADFAVDSYEIEISAPA